MEQTIANNRTKLLLAVLSIVMVAMLTLGFSAAPAEAAVPYCKTWADCPPPFWPYE